ncbi:TlpA family protein disulfide reductase [Anditalea andensis]|uniref:Thiol-disulfide oxidoreductase n=1 Tax=Anditalea andensis TaxID=1048983 RepID=A0A074KTH9_9BACT|nr:TlpA family protein disulfide reductase [Anditalea andensis]KEO72194.1 thiol-disulfide oxidoreductase [Anditalea andensis]
MNFLTNTLITLTILFTPLYPREVSINDLTVISYETFEEMVNTPSSQLRVYNFWATWCAPCIKEMPHFEKVNNEDSDIALYFISLDDGLKTERVTNFIKKRNIQAPVYLLDDIDYNKWIDKVHQDWSGAIPATLFVDANGKKHFHEGEMSEETLLSIINTLK